MSEARRAILEVRGGPFPYRRALISPMGSLRVGSSTAADVALTHDEKLAPVHLELHWDGVTCEIRSLAETMLAGNRVDRALVRSGDWIRAGGTDFSVFYEADPVKALPEAARDPLGVLGAIAKRRRLYAILDGARSDEIFFLLERHADEIAPLYDGVQAEAMAETAPWLVRFEPDSKLLPGLLQSYGDSRGIFLEHDGAIQDVRAHFRRLVVVTRERDNAPMFFRFYDPRVLRGFLPIATPRQESLFFGTTIAFYAEALDGSFLTFVRRTHFT